MEHNQFDNNVMPDLYSGGFINEPMDDLPAAMESEVYVDGKLQVRGGKKTKKSKKKKSQETNYFAELCGLLRVLWATRQTEDIDKVNNPDKYVRITLRELVIYLIFLAVLTISKLFI